MKSKFFIVALLLFAFNAIEAQNTITKKALFIIVDGIPADLIERIKPEYLTKISKAGGYTRAHVGGEKNGYSETPTISAVGYNSMLTATWVNKHNVWGNGIENPNYNYHTIFRMIKDVAPEKKLAVFSTWQDNRTKLIGEGKPETGNLLLDYKFDGLELDTVNFRHDKESKYIQKVDDRVALEAAKCITKNAPDLTWVYLQYTDDAGHHYGDSKKFDDAVLHVDKQIGKIYEAIQQRQKKHHEEWVIFVTTDHGRDAITGKGHGGQTARERGIWIVTNAKNLNNYFYAGNPGIVDIAPSIMQFLEQPISSQSSVEIDGVSLIGKISLANPYVWLSSSKKLQIGWDAYDSEGVVKISIAHTNNFQLTGTPDVLEKLGEVPIKSGKFVADFLPQVGKIYKIVLEGKFNTVNKWIIPH